NGHTDDVAFQRAAHLDLAGVNAYPHFDAQHPNGVDDGVRTPDRGAGTAECRDEPVPGWVYLMPAESLQFVTHDRVVVVQQVAPPAVAQQRRAFGGPDDVGEHDRGEQPLGVGAAAHAGDELLDLFEHRPG